MKIQQNIDVKLTLFTPPSLPGRAARACYGKRPDLLQANQEDDLRLARALLAAEHMEPFECSLLVFECLLPKFLCSQLNRHRIGVGRCQQSLRMSFPEAIFYWRPGVPLPKSIEDRFREDEAILRQASECRIPKTERELVLRQVSDNLMVQYTTWYNFREFLELCKKRGEKGAQLEAREYVALAQEQVFATPWGHLTEA